MQIRLVWRWLVGAALVMGSWSRPTSAETEYGGLDFSGFSAWGTTGAVGANATAGIPFGPSQKSRPASQTVAPPPQAHPRSTAPWPRPTVAQQPAPLPSPPVDALPASSPAAHSHALSTARSSPHRSSASGGAWRAAAR